MLHIPIPRLCHNCRHVKRVRNQNSMKLWHRKCQCNVKKSDNGTYQNVVQHFHGDKPCPNEFETSYSPDKSEIVYCDKCYLQEVY